jgi:hypothetical protein
MANNRKFLTVLEDGGIEKVDSYVTVAGVTALDGSNPTPIVTGLSEIIGFSLTLSKSTAPGVGTSEVTGVISGGNINMYAWKVTGAGDTTLIASTGTEDVAWVAVGKI